MRIAFFSKQAQQDGIQINVGDVMDTWTEQMNYPVVMVTKRDQVLTLTQERFLIDAKAIDPLTYTSEFRYRCFRYSAECACRVKRFWAAQSGWISQMGFVTLKRNTLLFCYFL